MQLLQGKLQTVFEIARKGNRNAAIMRAIDNNCSLAVIKSLVDVGGNINSLTNGESPLHRAAFRDNARLVHAVLSQGARIDIRNTRDGFTPLHIAAQFDNRRALQALINAGANLEAGDNKANTPLGVALEHESLGAAFMLTSAGADIEIKIDGQYGIDEYLSEAGAEKMRRIAGKIRIQSERENLFARKVSRLNSGRVDFSAL